MLRQPVCTTLLGVLLAVTACRVARVAPTTPAPPPPLFYEVMVRSFQDSNGDGVGDLRGLRQRLPYLQQLGVGGLWLTPIHPSPSYHGYDVTDFDGVNPELGTMEDLDALLQDAHSRHIKVLLDLVLNHTSVKHPWFAQHPDRYLWRDDDPGWTAPWPGGGRVWHAWPGGRFYFGVFWEGMPDLNLAHPDVNAAMVAMSKRWLARGVDGFRVDAARHLFEKDATLADVPQTHAYVRAFRAALGKPDVMLVAEAWAARPIMETYRGDDGKEFTHAFDFELAQAVAAALLSGRASHVAEQVRAVKDWGFEATFLSNHDMERLRSRLFSDAAVKAAFVILGMLPGTPFVWMGDELFTQQGQAAGDLSKRTPMKWTRDGGFSSGTPWLEHGPSSSVEDALADPHSAVRLLERLSALRAQHAGFAAGRGVDVVEGLPPSVLGLRRGAVTAWVNCGEEEVAISTPGEVLLRDVVSTAQALGPHGFVITLQK